MRRKNGFTLIEIIATITIMLIITAIAIPTALRSAEKGRQKEYEMVQKEILIAAEKYYEKSSDIKKASVIDGGGILLEELIPYLELSEEYIVNNSQILDPRFENKNQKCFITNVSVEPDEDIVLDKVKFEFEPPTEDSDSC